MTQLLLTQSCDGPVAVVAVVAAVAGEVRIASTYTQCLCVHVCLWDDL